MRKMVLGLAMAMTLCCVSAQAAVVGFQGSFDTKTFGAPGTGVYAGSVGPIAAITFNGHLNITDGTGAITGGFYTDSAGSTITVTGGTVTLTENGAMDSAEYNVLLGGDALGTLAFEVIGDVITDATINQANLGEFYSIPVQAVLTDFANGSGQYTGTIETIPEPSAAALMVGLVAGVAGWRRRRA